MKKNGRQTFFEYFRERGKTSVPFDVIMALYFAFCLGALVYFAVLGHDHVRDCFIALSYIAIVPIFYLLEYGLRIRASLPFELFILVYCVFCFLGASFNFYTIIPRLDDVLHMCWGLIFTALGFCVAKSLLGEPQTTKQFVAYLIFSAGFCMILSILWEIYEFASDTFLAQFDMQEDTIVNHIHSFMLHDPYDHLHTLQIDGIALTRIFDAEGNLLLEIPGYLDIGLIDTMMDIIWCVALTLVLCVILAVDRKVGKGWLYRHIIPVYVGSATANGV